MIGQQFEGKSLSELIFEATTGGRDREVAQEIDQGMTADKVKAQLAEQARKAEVAEVHSLLEVLKQQREAADDDGFGDTPAACRASRLLTLAQHKKPGEQRLLIHADAVVLAGEDALPEIVRLKREDDVRLARKRKGRTRCAAPTAHIVMQLIITSQC